MRETRSFMMSELTLLHDGDISPHYSKARLISEASRANAVVECRRCFRYAYIAIGAPFTAWSRQTCTDFRE